MINKELADKQGLSPSTRAEIERLHSSRAETFSLATRSKDLGVLKRAYDAWMKQERELQRLWGFEQNDNYIKFWEFPACSCPSMDNNDAYPTGFYTMSGGCVIHGDIVNKENKDEY